MLLPLPTPFRAGLGQLYDTARDRVTWAADFRAMPRVPLPTTADGWARLVGDGGYQAGVAPAALWRLDATGVVTCQVSGATLTPVGSPRQGQRIVGLARASGDDTWHRGVELADAGAARLVSSSTTLGDPGAGSLAVVLVLRCGRRPAAARVIARKRGASGAGWQLTRDTDGDLVWTVSDGTNTDTVRIDLPDDHAPRAVLATFDRDSGEIGLRASGAGSASDTITAVSVAVALPLVIGGETGVGLSPQVQVAHLAVVAGAAAEQLAGLALSWWPAGRAPSGVTYARAGRVATVVEDHATRGVQVAAVASGEVAYERAPIWEGAGLGASIWPALTNLAYSTDLADWGSVDGLLEVGAAESPTGEWTAARWTADTTDGYLFLDAVNPAVGKVWPRVFARTESGAPSTLELQIWDVGHTTLLASATHEIDGRWRHCRWGGGWQVPAAVEYYVAIVTQAAEPVLLWGPDVTQVGESAPVVLQSLASPATCPATDMRGTVAALSGDRGRLLVEYSTGDAVHSGDRYLVDAANAGSDANRRALRVTSSSSLASAVYSSAGALQSSPSVPLADEFHNGRRRAELAWSVATPITGTNRAQAVLDGRTVAGAGAGFTTSNTVTTVWLGQDRTGGGQLRGALRRVRVAR